MSLNPALEGKVYPEAAFEVDPSRVALFRAAVGDGSEVVPPTFATIAEFSVFTSIVEDPELGLDFARVVHTEQEYEWRRPLRVGETLTIRSRIASIRRRAGNGFLTIETELVDEAGQRVVLATSTMVERGA